MEEMRGAAITDMRSRGGERLSVFRTYTAPYLDKANLTVVPHALVTRVIFQDKRATGVEVIHDGAVHHVTADTEVVLSLGAIHTPKVLMQSGVGDQRRTTPRRGHGAPAPARCRPQLSRPLRVQLRMGVSRGLCKAAPRRGGMCSGTPGHAGTSMARICSPAWAPFPMVHAGEHREIRPATRTAGSCSARPTHPNSRGRLRLSGPGPTDPIRIEANALSDPARPQGCNCLHRNPTAKSAIRQTFVHSSKREVMPGDLTGAELEDLSAQCGDDLLARIGNGEDGPRCDVGGRRTPQGLRDRESARRRRIDYAAYHQRYNTMAPCVVIGERAAQFLKAEHQF